jgi:hypothetical protein
MGGRPIGSLEAQNCTKYKLCRMLCLTKGCTRSRIRNRPGKIFLDTHHKFPLTGDIFQDLVEFEKASPCMNPHGLELVGRAGQTVRVEGPARLYLGVNLYVGKSSLSGSRALQGLHCMHGCTHGWKACLDGGPCTGLTRLELTSGAGSSVRIEGPARL